MTRPIRVLHLANDLQFGGLTEYLHDLGALLPADQFELHVAFAGDDRLAERLAPRWSLHRLTERRIGFRRPADWVFALRLAQLRFRLSPDVVQGHLFPSAAFGWITFPAARTLFMPSESVLVPSFFYQPIRRYGWAKALVAGRVGHVLALGAWMRDEWEFQVMYPASRIIDSVHGVIPEDFMRDPQARAEMRAAHGIPDDAVVFGTIGRLSAIKNQRLLIEQAARFKDHARPWRILLLGDGEDASMLRETAAACGVADRVIFAGYTADRIPWMSAMDIHAFPMRDAPLIGKANLEALAMELPLLYFARCPFFVGMAHETIPLGPSVGFIADSETAFGDRLGDVLAMSDAERTAMGRRARALALARFDLRRHARDVAALYEQIAATGRA